jgi:AcrR family transcriptional regulator
MVTGLELFGTVGYNNTSVRALSAAASLNSRYFYEAFESREDLLYNVYQRIVEEMITNVGAAVQGENNLLDQTRAGIRAG